MIQPLIRLADGTVKQTSPFTGTQVWTVPGRGNRPFVNRDLEPQPIGDDWGSFCSFCESRYLDSPPERQRMVGQDFLVQERVPAGDLDATTAEFRRMANLFPILPLAYWQANHGYVLDDDALAWRSDYLADPTGRDHLLALGRRLASATGAGPEPEDQLLARCDTFFASSHELIIGRRHYVDGATSSDQLAGSGTLTTQEHAAYLRLSVAAAEDLSTLMPGTRYVTMFQNWLRPAGASFDHLHKQLAAIDTIPVHHEREIAHAAQIPDLYRRFGVDYARKKGLVIAENQHAVAFAGYGHRFPSIEIHSLSDATRPWELTGDALRGLSDVVRAAHIAAGPTTPCNEEWYYQPLGVAVVSPVRVVLKLRTATLAGFEGATKIYLTTMSPWDLQRRAVETLREHERHLGDLTIAWS